MVWITIIISIIQAIPTIINVIKMLRDLMKGHSKDEKAAVANELKGVLSRWKDHRNSKQAAQEVEDIIREVKTAAL